MSSSLDEPHAQSGRAAQPSGCQGGPDKECDQAKSKGGGRCRSGSGSRPAARGARLGAGVAALNSTAAPRAVVIVQGMAEEAAGTPAQPHWREQLERGEILAVPASAWDRLQQPHAPSRQQEHPRACSRLSGAAIARALGENTNSSSRRETACRRVACRLAAIEGFIGIKTSLLRFANFLFAPSARFAIL
jgi:hypothetical protein